MSEDIKEIIQTALIVAGIVCVIGFISDCHIKMDKTKENRLMIRESKIDSLDAKCRVYYE